VAFEAVQAIPAAALSERTPHNGNRNKTAPYLKELIKESGVKNAATTARITKLIGAARARTTLMFRYACEMAIRPPAVTWKEFESIFSRWKDDRRAGGLGNWIKRHAVERHISAEDVETELFDAIVNRRHGFLAAAAESASVPEHESTLNKPLSCGRWPSNT